MVYAYSKNEMRVYVCICEYACACVCVRMCVYDVMYTSMHVCIYYRMYTVNIEQDDKLINILSCVYATSLQVKVEDISSQTTITDYLFAWFHEPLLDM